MCHFAIHSFIHHNTSLRNSWNSYLLLRLLVSCSSKHLVLWVVYVILKYKSYWLRYSSPSKTVFSTIESPMMLTTIQYNAVVSLFFFLFFSFLF